MLGIVLAAVLSASAQSTPVLAEFPPGAVSFKAEPSFGQDGWTTVGFELDRGRLEQPRRFRARVRTQFTGDFDVYSDDCPAVVNLLDWLTHLSPPRYNVGGLVPYQASREGARPRRGQTDGVMYSVSGSGFQGDGSSVRLQMSGNSGPLAEWGQAVIENVKACRTKVPL